MYDYFVDPKKLDWEPWEPKVPPFRYLKTMPFHKMIVPTVDTVSTSLVPRTTSKVFFVGTMDFAADASREISFG